MSERSRILEKLKMGFWFSLGDALHMLRENGSAKIHRLPPEQAGKQ